jgi:hypothetical protein
VALGLDSLADDLDPAVLADGAIRWIAQKKQWKTWTLLFEEIGTSKRLTPA